MNTKATLIERSTQLDAAITRAEMKLVSRAGHAGVWIRIIRALTMGATQARSLEERLEALRDERREIACTLAGAFVDTSETKVAQRHVFLTTERKTPFCAPEGTLDEAAMAHAFKQRFAASARKDRQHM